MVAMFDWLFNRYTVADWLSELADEMKKRFPSHWTFR
jgi:hypothetical protein